MNPRSIKLFDWKLLSGLFIITATICHAQVGPPTAIVGAGKVLMERGTLDADVIAAVIATKQDEIKNELATRLVLGRLNDESFVLWNFVKQNMDLLLRERNADVMQKELLKNATELMIVAATLEFYMQMHYKRDENSAHYTNIPFTDILSNVIDAYVDARTVETVIPGTFLDQATLDIFYKFGQDRPLGRAGLPVFTNGKKRTDPLDEPQANKIKAISRDLFEYTSPTTGEYFPKPRFILDLKSYGPIIVRDKRNLVYKKLYLQNILMDMTYGILTRNRFIQQMGLFSKVPAGTARQKLDNYQYLLENSDTVALTEPHEYLAIKLRHLERCIEGDMNFLAKYSYVLSLLPRDLIRKGPTMDTSAVKRVIGTTLQSIEKKLLSLDYEEGKCKACDEKIFLEIKRLVDSKLSSEYSNDDNWLYHLQEVVIPGILQASIANGSKLKPLLVDLETVREAVTQRLLFNLLVDHNGLISLKRWKSDILFDAPMVKATMLRLINGTIDNLDAATTYGIVMNFITGLGKMSADPRVSRVAGVIIDAGEKYIKVDKDSNHVALNVEAMAVNVYQKFSENASHRLTPYFSVGINYNSPLSTKLKLADTTTSVKQYAFVSEKIGLKFKVIDWGRKLSMYDVRSDMPKKSKSDKYKKFKEVREDRTPFLQDLHVLVYGSGLLYQIQELSTQKFKSPQGGFGIGATFFNSLDLNVNYAFAMDRKFKWDQGMLNVSFDIKIVEYISALAKSQKVKKMKDD